MPTSLIIGSGPAAAGAALALAADETQRIIVVDVGGNLEEDRRAIRDSIASTAEAEWPQNYIDTIAYQPVVERRHALPEKRSYGSNYPFRDVGQLEGVLAIGAANRSVISGAYGGFSNLWGAQIMPFSAATFERWPISKTEMDPHYRIALNEMTFTADEDDLSAMFPLLTSPPPLPELGERTRKVLHRYEARRARVQSLGITVGRARLAMRSDRCSLCGLCMTGCPYGLIYSASHTFDRLRAEGRVEYRKGLLAVNLHESDSTPEVDLLDITSGKVVTMSADRIYVACGGIGSTRLVMGSLGIFDQVVELGESVQVVMPAISRVATSTDPRHERGFTLNQFNLVYDASGDGFDLCQIHFYPYNPVFETSLPSFIRLAVAKPLATALLRRLSVGLGYLPSWASPVVKVKAHPRSRGQLPELVIDRETTSGWPPMLRDMSRALLRAAPALDLWPLLPMTSVSAAAKSYHFGGSFPHSETRTGLATDRTGRLDKWEHIHLVDASVFPNIPATTFTLTIMANAHRIAAESLSLSG
jgi:choline dehydrogenase-like flavoprotein